MPPETKFALLMVALMLSFPVSVLLVRALTNEFVRVLQ